MPRISRIPRNHLHIHFCLLAVSVCALIGCNRPEPILNYKVPTKLPDQLVPGNDRMLATMFPKGDEAWFIKVTGPEKAIAEVESDFRRFVESISFQDSGPDLDKLPEKWRIGGEKPMRFASIDVETASKQLDISISKLPLRDDWDGFVADNVNRWRGQLGLPQSGRKWAEASEITIASADATGAWVDLVGEPSTAAGGEESKSRLQFQRPEGWRDGRKTSIRLAAFNVGAVDSEAEVTVISAGGGLRENVARWLGQVRGETPDAVVDQALKDARQIKVSGHDAQRFLLTGENNDEATAIDATIVPLEDGFSMFIKMYGPVATVTAQADAMTAFLESLEF